MSRKVELPDDVYARIEEAASATGNSVAEVIASRFPAPSPAANGTGGEPPSANGAGQAPRTLADEFAGRVGLVTLPETTTSERTSELFAQTVLEKYRSNQL
ncbi:MAG TPA: hypothetical protein VFS20_16990 [Longimicrobium sp.]|nr:hypothetical protein [Longimicrobium sp.]